jgi:hypothetical protein
MIRRVGLISGTLFLLGGALGFVPGVTHDGMYFGLFMVNTAHNLLHILSGALFLLASLWGAGPARLWFRIFGVFYGALALIGLRVGDGMVFGLISNNRYDAWGHAALSLIMLVIGFSAVTRARAPIVEP